MLKRTEPGGATCIFEGGEQYVEVNENHILKMSGYVR
jgi:hypothetical protein